MSAHLSRWFEIPQTRIDAFAEATEDHAPIHVDPDAKSPFGGTIAHGFLTLSMLSAMAYDALPPTPGVPVNYGLDRVRFISPVPSGAQIRARFTLANRDETPTHIAQTWEVEIEIQGATKPALAATWLTRHLTIAP